MPDQMKPLSWHPCPCQAACFQPFNRFCAHHHDCQSHDRAGLSTQFVAKHLQEVGCHSILQFLNLLLGILCCPQILHSHPTHTVSTRISNRCFGCPFILNSHPRHTTSTPLCKPGISISAIQSASGTWCRMLQDSCSTWHDCKIN